MTENIPNPDADHYRVRPHALMPPPGLEVESPEDADDLQAAQLAGESDRAVSRDMEYEMHRRSPYAGLGQTTDAQTDQFHKTQAGPDNMAFLCFKNDAPVGVLSASVQPFYGLDYRIAACHYIYVRPEERDGRAAAMLLKALHLWAEKRGADELRLSVISGDNIDRTHAKLTGMAFAHLGGNYAFPLTEKARTALGPIKAHAKTPTDSKA